MTLLTFSSFLFPFSFVFAVHIDDGILSAPWWVGGYAGLAVLMVLGSWRIRDEEISRIALMSGAFFVASLIHVRLPMTSVHLLLNGLVGVVLGRRSAIAIPMGLFLQAVLFHHGGLINLGVNSCVMTLPALLAWQLFRWLHRLPWLRQHWFQICMVVFGAETWLMSLACSAVLLFHHSLDALPWTVYGYVFAGALAASGLIAWVMRRFADGPEFCSGLLVGEATVLATIVLNATVLWWGGQSLGLESSPPISSDTQGAVSGLDELNSQSGPSSARKPWRVLALVAFVAHLPIVAIESVVLGFTVAFLARVKPEMLGMVKTENVSCLVETRH